METSGEWDYGPVRCGAVRWAGRMFGRIGAVGEGRGWWVGGAGAWVMRGGMAWKGEVECGN